MKNVIRNQQGFSLVELMVVVAIIGILAAMSVGQVQKQIAKSRQAEAKTNLAQIYTSEKTFFSEYAHYASFFNVIGVGFEGNMRYNTGFSACVGALAASGYTGAPGAGACTTGDTAAGYCQATGNCAMILTNGTQPPAPTAAAVIGAVTQTTFVADASSIIYQVGTTDRWSIDNTKNLTNPGVGIP